MAKRALRKAEDIERVPVDQPVDLDLSEDPVVALEPDVKDGKDKGESVVVHTPDPTVEDEEKTALKKQLESLQSAEAQRQEFERRAIAAERRNQELEQQSTQQVSGRLESDLNAVIADIQTAEEIIKSAKAEMKHSAAMGDHDAHAEANARLIEATANKVAFERDRIALEAHREKMKVPARSEVPDQQDPFENAIVALPDQAKNWLRNHREYMTDHRKNVKMQNAYFELMEQGVQAYSPQFFEGLETKLGMRQSATQEEEIEPRRTPVSAPVSRDPPSPATGQSTQTRITLTPEQREHARASMPDMPPAEAEKLYAQNLIKLNGLKKVGHYREN